MCTHMRKFMNISSVLTTRGYDYSTTGAGQTNAGRSFAEMLQANLSASSRSAVGADTKNAPVPGSLDAWLQLKISNGSIPGTVEDAGKKADQLSGYLSGLYSGAFKDADISGIHGLSASYADGEFGVTGRLVAILPNQPITGIGMGNSGVAELDRGDGGDSEPEPINFDYYGEMLLKRMDECLEKVFDNECSDALGEFSFNKAISELAKFKPEFKETFDKEPSTALDKYRDDILYYMENAMFPVKGN